MNPKIIETTTEEYKALIDSIKNDSFEMMVDLTVVDWFRKKEPRFEVVVQLLSTSQNLRKTVKVFVKDEDLLSTHVLIYFLIELTVLSKSVASCRASTSS